MRKTILRILLLLFLFTSCNQGDHFSIEGKLADKSYDGEWIFLVPLVNAPVERVDSTVIKNGSFSFSGKVSEPEIYIIRTRPLIRLSLQELLVVKEPGQIQAYIGQNSSAKGTPLNDSLQNWKNQKQLFDYQTRVLQQNLSGAGEAEKDTIQTQIDKLSDNKKAYYFQFAQNNRQNVVGEMVINMTKGFFTTEQKQELGIQDN